MDVLEGTGTVVVAGRILPRAGPGPDPSCDAALRGRGVPVTLTRPPGDRVVVDAATGAALEYHPGA
ncbi:hypothetical protein [Streptomyces sp. NPDC054787]